MSVSISKFAGRDENPRIEDLPMSPATMLPPSDTAAGVATMLPRLIRSVESALSRLSLAEHHFRHLRDQYPTRHVDIAHAAKDQFLAEQDVDTAVRLLRYAVLTWCRLSGVSLMPGEPIPCLDGTEYSGASLSDLES